MRMKDVSVMEDNAVGATHIVGRIGGVDGNSKNRMGGLSYINYKPQDIIMKCKTQLNGIFNVYQDLLDYFDIVCKLRGPDDKSFSP